MAVAAQKIRANEGSEIIKFTEGASFNFGYLFLGLTALIAIAGTFLLWSSNSAVENSLSEKRTEKDSIIAEITSPTYKDVERDASDFKAAVVELRKVAGNKYLISEFLPEFYKRITNDVQIKTLSISGKEDIAFNGIAKSYRSVADLVMALKSWPVLSDVTLSNVSLDVNKDGSSQAVFSIAAKIDKTKKVTEVVEEIESIGSSTATAAPAGSESVIAPAVPVINSTGGAE